MIVEDDQDFASLVKFNLERLNQNIQISIFSSAKQAIDALDKESFSVIISDYYRPEINGLKFLKIIRKKNISIPFIIFTGLDQEELEEQSFSAGATYFIKKGTNFKQSISELNKFLNFFFIQQRKALREGTNEIINNLSLNSISSFNPDLHLDLILQNIEFGFYVLDLSGKLVYANKKGAIDLGFSSVQFLLDKKSNSDIFKILDIYNPKYFDFLTKRFSFKTGDELFSDEMININTGEELSNQKWFLKKISPIFSSDLSLQFVAITTYDMTNVMKNEFESHRELQQSLLLNNCLDLLYHIIDEQHFMDSFCKLLVEKGDYILVWIGSAEIHHNQKIVIPISSYGFETDYLDNIKITWDDTSTGEGPVGTAIKTGRYSVFNDITSDANFAPWRTDALSRGYHSCIAIPLQLNQDSHVQGSVNIYSSKKNAFIDKDINLLSKLARLLVAGLQILKTGTDLLVEKNFNEFPIGLIDANIKDFFKLTNEIKKHTLNVDFRDYIENHPEIVTQSLETVKINKANNQALKLLNANFESLVNNFSKTVTSKANFTTFKEIIISLHQGKKELIKKIVINSSDGKEINSLIKIVLESKSKKFMDHLLIAIITT